jgi:hypothetical protein
LFRNTTIAWSEAAKHVRYIATSLVNVGFLTAHRNPFQKSRRQAPPGRVGLACNSRPQHQKRSSKALGLTIPEALLATADEVFQ